MDDFDDDEELTSFTWASFKFKTIRIVDTAFTSHVNTMKVEISTGEDATETDIKLVLDKVHFWFDRIVSNSIIFERSNDFALSVMFTPEGVTQTDNIPMITPGVPSDDLLAKLFQSKLNALGNGHVHFGMVELTSDTKENLTFMYTGDGESELPEMDDWIGENTYFELPWWARCDGTTLDVVPPLGADLTKPPVIGVDLSFIDEQYAPKDDTAVIIVRPQFKPEVITGGKDGEPDNTTD